MPSPRELADPVYVAALAAAWRDGGVVPRNPPIEPESLRAAFAVQAGVAAVLDQTDLPGWKVGFAKDGTPIAAPLFARSFRRSGAKVALPRGQPLRVELEIAFRLARDLPPREPPYTREEALAAVGEFVAGIESLVLHVDPGPGLPFPVQVADNMSNEGYVAGDAVRDLGGRDLRALRCRLDVDGTTFHDATGGHPQGDPIEPLRAWASAGRHPLGPLRAGQLVTTGSLTPPLPLDRPARIVGVVEGIGGVALDVA